MVASGPENRAEDKRPRSGVSRVGRSTGALISRRGSPALLLARRAAAGRVPARARRRRTDKLRASRADLAGHSRRARRPVRRRRPVPCRRHRPHDPDTPGQAESAARREPVPGPRPGPHRRQRGV